MKDLRKAGQVFRSQNHLQQYSRSKWRPRCKTRKSRLRACNAGNIPVPGHHWLASSSGGQCTAFWVMQSALSPHPMTQGAP